MRDRGCCGEPGESYRLRRANGSRRSRGFLKCKPYSHRSVGATAPDYPREHGITSYVPCMVDRALHVGFDQGTHGTPVQPPPSPVAMSFVASKEKQARSPSAPVFFPRQVAPWAWAASLMKTRPRPSQISRNLLWPVVTDETGEGGRRVIVWACPNAVDRDGYHPQGWAPREPHRLTRSPPPCTPEPVRSRAGPGDPGSRYRHRTREIGI